MPMEGIFWDTKVDTGMDNLKNWSFYCTVERTSFAFAVTQVPVNISKVMTRKK